MESESKAYELISRKVGGLYLMGSGSGVPCDRLPLSLSICPCCSQGIKQSRGWTWIDVNLLVGGVHSDCRDTFPCPLCMATSEMGRVGLLWIGEKFYKTPEAFLSEAATQGISRRLSAVPRNFKIGETWVLLAHPLACNCTACHGSGLASIPDKPVCSDCDGKGKTPGIFRVFRPHAIEYIITQSQSQDAEFMADVAKRGLTPVVVPDDDKDHRGSVHDRDIEVAA